jgi:tRNA (Thr-GGU) A37 N-methylase
VTLDHLQDEKVAVSETDKEVRIAGGRVHALKETFKGLEGVEECMRVCVCGV